MSILLAEAALDQATSSVSVLCSGWLAVSNVNVPAITAVKSTLSAGNEQGQIVGAITAIQVCPAVCPRATCAIASSLLTIPVSEYCHLPSELVLG